jgi:hypothetical protein
LGLIVGHEVDVWATQTRGLKRWRFAFVSRQRGDDWILDALKFLPVSGKCTRQNIIELPRDISLELGGNLARHGAFLEQ